MIEVNKLPYRETSNFATLISTLLGAINFSTFHPILYFYIFLYLPSISTRKSFILWNDGKKKNSCELKM